MKTVLCTNCSLTGTNSHFKTSIISELSLKCYQIHQKVANIIQISKITSPVLLENKLFFILDSIHQTPPKSQWTTSDDQNKEN